MRFAIHVNQSAAIRRGVNARGPVDVDIDPAKLTQEQREILAEVATIDGRIGSYRWPHGTNEIKPDGGILETDGPTVEDVFAGLERSRQKALAARAAYVANQDEEIVEINRRAAANLAARTVRTETAYPSGQATYERVVPDSGGYGYRRLNYAQGRESEVATWNSPEWAAWEAECEALTEANRASAQAAREAEQEAKRLEAERVKAEREAAVAAGKTRLREWAENNGSDLTILRMEEGYECWVSSAADDYFAEVCRLVASGLAVAETPDGWDANSEDCKCPGAKDIETLRDARDAAEMFDDEFAAFVVTVKLVRVTYTEDDTEDDTDQDEDTTRHQNELAVEVHFWPGLSRAEYFKIPS